MRILILITLLLFTLVFGIVYSAWADSCRTDCDRQGSCVTHCDNWHHA